MCARGWQLGCGSSPGHPLNPEWAGESPPVPLHLLCPPFCPSPSGIVRFSCLAAARGAQESHARSCGTQPGRGSLLPSLSPSIQALCPPCCIPDCWSLLFPWLASVSAVPPPGRSRRGDRSCGLQKSCRAQKSPNPPKSHPDRAHNPTPGTGTGRSSPRDRSSHAGATGKQNSSLCPSPLFCWEHFAWKSIVAGKEGEITPGGATPGFGGAQRCCPAPPALTWDL